MIFNQGKKSAILWNKKTNKPLFRFVERKLETEDIRLIKLLKKQGYQVEE